MLHNQFSLLTTKRFLPLFLTQFLGAFNDNVFKNAMVILITYQLAEQAGVDGRLMVTAAAGVFIFPFFILSATAGQLADKYEKSALIRKVKAAEICIMLIGSIALFSGDISLLMLSLFLLGAQAAFFGPLKYGILPDHLKESELVGGNAMVSASTFIAILTGTIFGGLFIMAENGVELIAFSVMLFSFTGWICSRFIPETRAASPALRINKNFIFETFRSMSYIFQNRQVAYSIIGISWFWFVGATFLAQFPNFVKYKIGANEEVATLFLTAFSIGIAIGALLCNSLLRGRISAKYVPLGGLGIVIFSIDLFLASNGLQPASEQLMGMDQFTDNPMNIRIFSDLLLISISGGIFVVPLYAVMQSACGKNLRSRTIASNNILNSMMMVVSAIIPMLLFAAGFDVDSVFLMVAISTLVVTGFLYFSSL